MVFGLKGGALICLYKALVKLGTITIASSAVGRSFGFLLKNASTKFLNFYEYAHGSALGFLLLMMLPRVIKLSA